MLVMMFPFSRELLGAARGAVLVMLLSVSVSCLVVVYW